MKLELLKQQLNYDNPIDGTDLDMQTYDKKFEMWDYVVKNSLFENGDINAINLLNDPTIYAYAFFRDDEGHPFKYTAYQDAIVNCHHDHTATNPNRMIIFKAANQIGKCVNGWEKLINENGSLICMKDIKKGDKILSHKKGKIVESLVTQHEHVGEKDCFLIKTKTGKRIRCSKKHKFLTPSGWQNIESGLCKHNYIEHGKLEFKDWKSMVLIPKELNYFPEKNISSLDNVIVLSYLLTDGYIGKDGQTPKFTNNSMMLLDEFEEKLLNQFKVKIKKYIKNDGFDYIVSGFNYHDNELTNFLKKINAWEIKDKRRVPQFIFDRPKQDQAVFINRAFACDGCASIFKMRDKLDGRLSFYAPSELFVEDLRNMLLKFGIHSTLVIEKPTKKNKATKNGYRIAIQNPKDILRFFYEIGLIYSKEEQCEKLKDIMLNKLSLQKYDLREKYDNDEFFWDFITSIEYIGKDDFYDIEVKDTHNFICNGIVTHNSRMLCGEAIRLANVKENVNIVMVSKSLPQSQFLLAQIRHTLNNSVFSDSWREDIGETKNTTTLSFKRETKDKDDKVIKTIQNRIICAPKGEGLLGYPVHYLFLDEADFYEDAKNFFWKIALPRTNKTKGQIVLFSNPNPDISRNTSLLWELWNSDLVKRKFSFKFLDAPWNTKEEYDMIKKSSPSYIFASTHDGKFPEDAGGFFKHSEIQDMLQKDWVNELPMVDRPVYIGIDFAKTVDQSVMVIATLHKNGTDPTVSDIHVRYMKAFPQKTDYDIVIADLKRIIDYYHTNFQGVANIGFDATGVGKAIDDIMRMTGIQTAIPITFSIESKTRMYANFKMLAEQRRIKVVYDHDCEKQLSGLVFTRTATGRLTVKHEKEQVHDDYPDAICCLCEVALTPTLIEPTVRFF